MSHKFIKLINNHNNTQIFDFENEILIFLKNNLKKKENFVFFYFPKIS